MRQWSLSLLYRPIIRCSSPFLYLEHQLLGECEARCASLLPSSFLHTGMAHRWLVIPRSFTTLSARRQLSIPVLTGPDVDEPQWPFFSRTWAGRSPTRSILVHGQVTIIYVVSVCLSVCFFVCLCRVFSAVFDPIWIKLGHMLHVRV